MSAGTIVTDARIIEHVEAGKPVAAVRLRLPEILLWTVLSVVVTPS